MIYSERADRVAVGLVVVGGGLWEPAVSQVEASQWPGRRQRRKDGKTQEEPRKCAEWRRPSSITARLCSGVAALKEHREGARVHV